ncbi:MAG: nucleotidyltransferase domain-containing protein [Spirochaetales bacterium]|nr:nucleotidyltransferase domain-containing protein [Spirochaetales bacterium]
MISNEMINNLVKIIVEEERPEKIILFGSYSAGVPNEESDVDILIVKETNVPKPKRAHRLLRRFSSYPFNTDIIVKTPEEFEKQASIPGSFVSIVKQRGKILYG